MSSQRNKTTVIAAVIAVTVAVVTFIALIYFGLSGERGKGQPVPGGYYLQEAATPVMEDLTTVYNMVYWWISGIVAFVMALMVYIMIRFREKANPVPSKTTHHVGLEIAWTIAPVIILLTMVVPSMQLLYFQDVVEKTEVTVKAVGATGWWWDYVYEIDGEEVAYSSFMAGGQHASYEQMEAWMQVRSLV